MFSVHFKKLSQQKLKFYFKTARLKNKCFAKVLEIANAVRRGDLQIGNSTTVSQATFKDVLYNLSESQQYDILCKMKEGQITPNEIRKDIKVKYEFVLSLTPYNKVFSRSVSSDYSVQVLSLIIIIIIIIIIMIIIIIIIPIIITIMMMMIYFNGAVIVFTIVNSMPSTLVSPSSGIA